MKNFDRIKTIQMILLVAVAIFAVAAVFRDRELYALIAANSAARLLAFILWLVLGASFIFLLIDLSNYSHMKRENLQLDKAVYSDALTGVANRYSIDAYLAQFYDKPLPQDMGAITLVLTDLAALNDKHGHSAGDLAIQTFAGMLQTAAQGACFVGRNGGNKFAVIIRDCTQNKIDRFLASVADQTEKYNAEHPDACIRYKSGAAFDEGESVKTAGGLVALSDRRAG